MSVSTLQQWIARKTREVTLPSGAQVVVSLPDVSVMAKNGRIPNELVPFALKYETSGIALDPLTDDERLEFIRFCRIMAAAAVVSPALSVDQIDDIPLEDYTQLLAWALRREELPGPPEPNGKVATVAELAPFRDESGSDQP